MDPVQIAKAIQTAINDREMSWKEKGGYQKCLDKCVGDAAEAHDVGSIGPIIYYALLGGWNDTLAWSDAILDHESSVVDPAKCPCGEDH